MTGTKGIFAIIERIENGFPIIFPTTTLPGLGCKPIPSALDKLFELKKRDHSKPVSIAVANLEQARELVELSEYAIQLIQAFPPSSLSVILPAKSPLDKRVGGTNIAIRLISHPIAKHLIEIVGPLTATSANIADQPVESTCEAAAESLNMPFDAILEGKCQGGLPSTLVSISSNLGKPESVIIIREGVVPRQDVEQWSPNQN